jgi:ankyrin repeat protein
MAAEEAIFTFFGAVFNGIVAEVGRLLDEDGRLVGAQIGQGHTPLHLAVAQGRLDMVRLLLGRGADIDAINGQGCTALHLAVSSHHEEIQNVLLDCGADASRAGFRGVTPLTAAVGLGDMDTVRRLLRSLRGRGLDAQVDIGVTAFLWACGDGRADIARLLLLEGADHTIGWQEGTPAARLVEEAKGHEECVALIQVRTHMTNVCGTMEFR